MEKRRLTEETLEDQIDRARNRAMLSDATEPRTVSAHYDRASSQMMIHFRDKL